MNKIDIIQFQGHYIDVYNTPEEPLFLAVEIARIIDYSVGKTGQMLDTVDDDEKVLVRYNISHQRGGNRKPVWFLTEDGLYEVLFQSRKPIAKQFKAVVKRILKDLRVTNHEGSFSRWFNYLCEQYGEYPEQEIDEIKEVLEYEDYTTDKERIKLLQILEILESIVYSKDM